MASISGQPAPKPSQLSNPVPGENEAQDVADFLASAPPPPSFKAQGGEAASFLQQAPPPPAQIVPEPGFLEANIDQFKNFTTRIQAGLAANDQEKLGFLQKKFGQDNAIYKDGKLYFRRATGEKFKPLDPDTLEVINDIIPDFAREIVTEAGMLPAELAGAAAFAPLGPAGATAGALSARVAAVPMANEFADRVAALAGVSQDETRNRAAENTIGVAAEAILPAVGRKIVKMIPGTTAGVKAYNASKEAGEKEIVALSKQSQEVAKAVNDLSNQGRAAKINGEVIGIPDANVNLMGHQINPDNPILQKFANVAASDPRFINAQQQLAEDWGKSLDNTLVEIGRRNNPGPYRPEVLAQNVTNAVTDLQKAEGEAIGRFKAKAMATLKNEKLPLNQNTVNDIKDLLTQFGFNPRIKETQSVTRINSNLPQQRRYISQLETAWNPPKNLNALVGKMGLTSTGEVRAVVNNLNELAKGLDKGLKVSDLERFRGVIGELSQSLPYNASARARFGRLAGDLRQTYRQAIETGLDNDIDRKAFNDAMDTFSSLRENVAVLESALTEDASAQAIVKNFFTGKENLQKIKAIKKISPQSFAALKEAWINQLMIDFGSRESKTGFKSGAFLDALNKKYGEQFAKEVLNDGPGPNFDTLKNILTVTERIEQTTKGLKVDQMTEAQKKGVMDLGIGLLANIKFKAVNGLTALFRGQAGSEKALVEIMTRDGIDKYLAAYPGKIDKKTVRGQLNEILATSKFYKALEREGAKLQRPAKAVIKGEMQRQASE